MAGGEVRGGSVIAADIDTHHLCTDVPRMTPLVHDVVTDEFPPASFDLVHTRMLLMHLHQPEAPRSRKSRAGSNRGDTW